MAVLEGHTVTYSTTDVKEIFYHAAGPADGPLLIFIHGWPAIGKTWKKQLEAFALLGFRCIAPDMPGYGRSTARKVATDYAQEAINLAMMEVLRHAGQEKAVWIGHDWGCGSVWSFAEQYPEHCVGAVGMAVPARTFESGGLEEAVRTVNRDMYPEDQYPYGQWDYQRFYQVNFEKATQWMDADIPAFMRACFTRSQPPKPGVPSRTATIQQDGGWNGGSEKPDPMWRHVPIEAMSIDEELYQELTTAMQRTSFWGANAWYSNHDQNKAYFEKSAKNDGYLHMPTLFIEATWDTVCDTKHSKLGEAQRKYCTNLTEASIDCGHWIPQEAPEKVNAILARWLVESVKDHWPIATSKISV